MKVSELWLKTLIHPPLNMSELADQLTNAGLEVDHLEMIELPLKDLKDHTDTVLTLKIPANRGDCLSMEGVARELAALNQMSYQAVEFKVYAPQMTHFLPIRVEALEACPRYIGRLIQNINPRATTPHWMQQRLIHGGIRPVSPVVDVTNYVMLELGQPLHAFDADKLDHEIVVRFANPSESITTLEGVTLILTQDTLVIADKKVPVAVAGIMGGLNSSVTDTTRNIFLESAYFNPINIRKSAKRFGIRTESSIRFERGIDPNLPMRALERATQLLVEIVGGNAGPSFEQCDARSFPKPQRIFLRHSKVQRVLGVVLEDEEIQTILRSLGMDVMQALEGWEILVPSFRVDITLEEDLIEEIARVYGYHRFPNNTPIVPFVFNSIPENTPDNRLKQALVDRGYKEAITYSFIAPHLVSLFQPEENILALANPISTEMAAMRGSLWPGLAQAVLYNQRRKQDRVRLFEMGVCFSEQDQILNQKKMLGGICVGPLFREQWGTQSKEVDYFDVKADIEALNAFAGKDNEIHFQMSEHPAFHPGQGAEIFKNGTYLGRLGVLHPHILKALDLQGKVVVFELEVESLSQKKLPQFSELSKYPAIRRDIAILVARNVSVDELKSAILLVGGTLLKEVRIFDIYEGKGIDPASKSVALGLILQHPLRTLVDAEVNEVVEAIVKTLSYQYKAILRE